MDQTTPLVSVIIPTCNRREILRRCLDALAAQTQQSCEIVIVDDASDDDTPAMLEQFGHDHPDVALVVHVLEDHSGANVARNIGIGLSKGEFIAFLDSDCIPEADWLEKLLVVIGDAHIAGACGLVLDPEPRNIYDLAFRGTHNALDATRARRLIGGNMCLRREVFDRFSFDTDPGGPAACDDSRKNLGASGRCDEETLYIRLRRAGFEIAAAHDARVLHVHHYDRRSFFSQAFRGGKSAARLVHKHYLPHRKDLIPFMLGYATLPLGLLRWWLLVIPLAFLGLGVAAIVYNDLFLKRKAPLEVLRSFPVLLVYYHVRVWGYVTQLLKLYAGTESLERERIEPTRVPTG